MRCSIADPVVLSERFGAVLLITLNRPERLNAWTDEMEGVYFDMLAGADADAGVGAIVVTGSGRGFCAGADMRDLQQIGAGTTTHKPLTRPKTFPLTVRKPLIAAINGACAGLGLVQALYCDVRFVAADATLTTSSSRRGLIAEHGISWWLTRQIGPSRALDLLLSARVFDGVEAVALGLAHSAIKREDVVDAALGGASDLATNCSRHPFGGDDLLNPSSRGPRPTYRGCHRRLDAVVGSSSQSQRAVPPGVRSAGSWAGIRRGVSR